MSICLLTIRDGRDEVHERSQASALDNLPRHFAHQVVVDDADHNLGFAGAIAEGWARVLDTGAEFCFWLEADFEFLRPVPIWDMRTVLKNQPHLVQMALLRQPVNDSEVAAGGIVQQHPEDFERCSWLGYPYLAHRRFFTTNPCLVPTWVMRSGWPQVKHSEGKFGVNLFATAPTLRSAFWGEGEEWVEHIGTVRAGHSY